MKDPHSDRLRMTLAEARDPRNHDTNMISHILDNGDGTYSIMYHIVCEHCDYCDSQGDCREGPREGHLSTVEPVPYKFDAYELNGR